MATSDAPISIGRVVLTVRDLDKMAEYYETVIGLGLIERDGETALLGVNDKVLIELRQDRAATVNPGEAGLFHTAFLLPSRGALGAWLGHLTDLGGRLDGASHHGVSEALYLDDPEGNGIEIYRDLPRDAWVRRGDRIEMVTKPLDMQALRRDADQWQGAPEDTVVGHVHLRVGDVAQAADFIRDQIGMTQTFDVPAARWFGSGGYHHHVAANEWHSKGAGPRAEGSAGLASVELLAQPGLLDGGPFVDPWGTTFTVSSA